MWSLPAGDCQIHESGLCQLEAAVYLESRESGICQLEAAKDVQSIHCLKPSHTSTGGRMTGLSKICRGGGGGRGIHESAYESGLLGEN